VSSSFNESRAIPSSGLGRGWSGSLCGKCHDIDSDYECREHREGRERERMAEAMGELADAINWVFDGALT
jgi:hypothetical protein